MSGSAFAPPIDASDTRRHPMIVNYVPPPTEFAVLVVHRDARTLSTPQADHLLQSSSERRRYPDRSPQRRVHVG